MCGETEIWTLRHLLLEFLGMCETGYRHRWSLWAASLLENGALRKRQRRSTARETGLWKHAASRQESSSRSCVAHRPRSWLSIEWAQWRRTWFTLTATWIAVCSANQSLKAPSVVTTGIPRAAGNCSLQSADHRIATLTVAHRVIRQMQSYAN